MKIYKNGLGHMTMRADCNETWYMYIGEIVSDESSKLEVLSGIAQATAALTRLTWGS